MGTRKGTDPKTSEYQRAICEVCKGDIPLTRDGKLRLHRQRNHHLYGVPNALVPYCPASRTRMHSNVARSS